MNRKDLELMMEAYGQIEEGLFSRAKARVAGVAGSARGAIQRGKGQLHKAAGSVVNAFGETEAGDRITARGDEMVDAGRKSGDNAKKESITKSIIAGVVDDLTKLGLEGQPDLVNKIQAALNSVFDEFLKPPFDADEPAESETGATQPETLGFKNSKYPSK